MMNERKISRVKESINEMFGGEKSKGFAVHLIQSFGNLNTIHKVKEEKDLKDGAKCRCSVCSKKLMTSDEVTHTARFIPKDDAGTEIRFDIEADVLNTLPDIKDFRGVKQAYISTKSNRVLCEDCIAALAGFIADELTKENEEMVKITTPKPRRPRKPYVQKDKSVGTTSQTDKFNKFKKVEHKGKSKPKKESRPNVGLQALAGNEALLALKAKLEQGK